MKLIRPLVIFAVVICLASAAVAQVQTAELLVTVKDASGGVVRNASVTVLETARGISRTVTINTDGVYQFLSLTPGLYTITV